MKVPGIEEMQDTFMAGANEDGQDSWVRRGLLAVFETHVKAMLAEAFAQGASYEPPTAQDAETLAKLYASEILSQLKEPRHD